MLSVIVLILSYLALQKLNGGELCDRSSDDF
jgi:hypothetical protein